jgi:hypothetical protein
MTIASYTTWIILLTVEASGAKEKKGGIPTNAAAAGHGFTTGAVFFWEENHNSSSQDCHTHSALLPSGVDARGYFFTEDLDGLAIVLAAENSRPGDKDVCAGRSGLANGVRIYAAVNFD